MKLIVQANIQSRRSRHDRSRPAAQRMRFVACAFQSPEADSSGRSTASPHEGVSEELRSFRNLSRSFEEKEAPEHFRFEAALFAVIAALSAWPVLLTLQAAAVLLRQ